MALFEVKGWSLPDTIVSHQSAKKKKSESLVHNHRKIQRAKSQDSKAEKTKAQRAESQKSKRKPDEPRTKNSRVTKSPTSSRHRKHDQPDKPVDTQAPDVVSEKSHDLTPLQQKMKEKLTGSRFRWINEQLYTIPSDRALQLIQEQPRLFDEYHAGFRNQVKNWPENPVNAILNQIQARLLRPLGAPGGSPADKDGTVVIADMGCGEAELALKVASLQESVQSNDLPVHTGAKRVQFKVHSFDLHPANERITVADIKAVPLPSESCHLVIYCLSLMGTNFLEFIKEGIRVLKARGEMWIAEIKSRFTAPDTRQFVEALKELGLLHKRTDDSNKMFVRLEFFKPPEDIALEQLQKRKEKANNRRPKFIEAKEVSVADHLLKPCIYKRR